MKSTLTAPERRRLIHCYPEILLMLAQRAADGPAREPGEKPGPEYVSEPEPRIELPMAA